MMAQCSGGKFWKATRNYSKLFFYPKSLFLILCLYPWIMIIICYQYISIICLIFFYWYTKIYILWNINNRAAGTNSAITLTSNNGIWRWILSQLTVTSFSQYSKLLTTDSKFSAIYHCVVSMWHLNEEMKTGPLHCLADQLILFPMSIQTTRGLNCSDATSNLHGRWNRL